MFNSDDEQSGAFGVLMGFIILIFAGIGISLLVDRRFSFSKSEGSVSRSMEDERVELESLQRRLEKSQEHWSSECEPLLGQSDSFASVHTGLKALEQRKAELLEERENVSADLERAVEASEAYRDRYRMQVRGEAAGEQFPEMKSRSGRIYKNVTIRRVSSAGIEIRHDEGNSRLLPEELDVSWRERFQWEDSEVALQLENERASEQRHSERVTDSGGKAVTAAPREKNSRSGAAVKKQPDPRIGELRQALVDARERLRQMESEAMRARSEARTSRGRSVPGSLETWSARASRLESSSVKLRAVYRSARGKLASVSPNDPLLLQN